MLAQPEEYTPVNQNDEPIPVEVAKAEQVQLEVAEPDQPDSSSTPRRFGLPGSMAETKGILMVVGAVIGVIAVGLVILLPMSFGTLEYYEMGFKRRKSTGSVDTNSVYLAGRHAVGPDYEFKKFPADANYEYFDRVTVFASDRLQVTLSASMQYFLRPHQLEKLHKNFDIHYAPVLRNNAVDALKGAATLFSTREFIRQREDVEKALFKAIRERLGGNCCELGCDNSKPDPDKCVPGCKPYDKCREESGDYGLFVKVGYFQLAAIDIPSDVEERYLQSLVLQEETETEKYKQQAQLVRKTTDAMVYNIQNEAAEISQNGTAEANLIATTATADASARVERARTQGLKHLYDELKLTDSNHRASFDYLRTLKEKSGVKLAVDFQQLVAGPFK